MRLLKSAPLQTVAQIQTQDCCESHGNIVQHIFWAPVPPSIPRLPTHPQSIAIQASSDAFLLPLPCPPHPPRPPCQLNSADKDSPSCATIEAGSGHSGVACCAPPWHSSEEVQTCFTLACLQPSRARSWELG